MNVFKKLFQLFVSPFFAFFAGISSILSLLIAITSNKDHTLIALVVFIIFLLILLIYIFFILGKVLNLRNESGFLRYATILKYSTLDGKNIVFESYRFIQCKDLLLSEYEHKYYWTGSQKPKISSNNLNFVSLIENPQEYDVAKFRMETPLKYNETGVLNIKMDINDSDKKSSTHLEMTVREPVRFFQFRVELKHSIGDRENAILKRKKVSNASSGSYKEVCTVSFDAHTKSYEHILTSPEVGYAYRLEWNRTNDGYL